MTAGAPGLALRRLRAICVITDTVPPFTSRTALTLNLSDPGGGFVIRRTTYVVPTVRVARPGPTTATTNLSLGSVQVVVSSTAVVLPGIEVECACS